MFIAIIVVIVREASGHVDRFSDFLVRDIGAADTLHGDLTTSPPAILSANALLFILRKLEVQPSGKILLNNSSRVF